MSEPAPTGPILFFDGVCNLCNRFVDFLIRHDRTRSLKFAPLQGSTATGLGITGLDSVVYWDGRRVWRESAGALRALGATSPWLRPLLALLVVPGVLRDGVYRWVARSRYRWFGKREVCRVPTPEERARFLP